MKRTFVSVIFCLLIIGSSAAWAQQNSRFTIVPHAGYRTGGSFDIFSEEPLDYVGVHVSDGFAYGLSIGISLNINISVEAMWSRSQPTVEGLAPANVDLFKIFDKIFIMTEGGPGSATEISNIFAYRINFRFWNLGYGAAIVTLLYIVSFLVCFAFVKIATARD